MAREIERKFLVKSDEYKALVTGKLYLKQAYLCFDPVVRVRIAGKKAFFAVKSTSKNGGLTRDEWEWAISVREASELMKLHKGKIIEKIRYIIPWENHVLEVDEFIRPVPDLVLAEIELNNETEHLSLPDWIGEEVTGKEEYYNAFMSKHG